MSIFFKTGLILVLLMSAVNLYFFLDVKKHHAQTENKKNVTTEQPVLPSKNSDPEDKAASKEESAANDKDKKEALTKKLKKGVVMIHTKVFKELSPSYRSEHIGTGFIVDLKKGLIVTNHHVVGESSVCEYEIKFSDNTVKKAKLKYVDPLQDFAFLIIDPKDIPQDAIELHLNDAPIKNHEEVFAIGNTSGDEFSSYEGKIFNIYQTYGTFAQQSFCFSGIVSGGASGSPVFNADGQVIGLLYGGRFTSGSALPIRYVTVALQELQKNKLPNRRSLGVILHYQNFKDTDGFAYLPEDAIKEYNAKYPDAQSKVIMVHTRISSLKAGAKFKAGDIIWKVNDQLIGPEFEKLQEMVDQPSNTIKVEVYRDHKLVSFTVSPYSLATDNNNEFIEFAGAMFYNHVGELQEFQIGTDQEGVYLSSVHDISPFKKVVQHSWFSSNSIVRITELNGKPMKTLKDLEEAIPELMTKKVFHVRFIDYTGQTFGEMSVKSINREERFVIGKYDGKYDLPKKYHFNHKTLEWDVIKFHAKEENK